jgi:hypothetical protein
VKSPKPQPKRKTSAPKKKTEAKATKKASDFGVNPAYIRLPPHPKPMIECPPLNHPRGKDGGWGS